jgi:hypothetical protein
MNPAAAGDNRTRRRSSAGLIRGAYNNLANSCSCSSRSARREARSRLGGSVNEVEHGEDRGGGRMGGGGVER